MDYFRELQQTAESYLPSEQIDILKKAYLLAENAHNGQFRSSGEPYITHPVAVANILGQMRLDYETLTAAILHDVIEDTSFTYEQISQEFGQTIAELVDGVSKLDKLKFRNRQEAQVENFRKMLMAMVQDIRVIFIKLADRTHNMRTLASLRPEKRRRIAKETLEIYSLLAHRLGINNLKLELEELGFAALYPLRYNIISDAIEIARNHQKAMIQRILLEIKAKLEDGNIKCEVYALEKTVYTTYQKMKLKEQRFHSIMDIYSIRVIVDDIDACYRVLGRLHSLYKPRFNRFKDYISVPKVNGYQSLHTSMVGPNGVPIEALIRTTEMNNVAEMGIATYWRYKAKHETNSSNQIKVQRWMQSLLELQKSAGSSVEFIDGVKSDLFPREIYIFTPKGRIIELPTGSTPVDFAYAVHTDIGNHCIGANVDKHPYPLSQALSSGQTVDIIVSKDITPSAQWLNYVVSSKARDKIRHALKKQKREDAVKLGEKLLTHLLEVHHCDIKKLPKEKINSLLTSMKVSNLNDLYANISLGNITSSLVAEILCDTNNQDQNDQTNTKKLVVYSSNNLLLTQAKCCYPIPNDPIIGHISPEKGLVIHYVYCRNIKEKQVDTEHIIDVEWALNIQRNFVANLIVRLLNKQDTLTNVINEINTHNATLQNFNKKKSDGRVDTLSILLEVKNDQHLAEIISAIQQLNNIISVDRYQNSSL